MYFICNTRFFLVKESPSTIERWIPVSSPGFSLAIKMPSSVFGAFINKAADETIAFIGALVFLFFPADTTNYLDPCIDVLQINGRIRNEKNPFRDYIIHLTNSHLTYRLSSRSNSSLDIDISENEINGAENVSRYFMYRQKVHQKYESIIESYEKNGQSAILGGESFINKYCTLDKRKSIEIIYNILVKDGNEKNFPQAQKMFWDQNPEIGKVINKFGIEKLKAVSFKLGEIKELHREESLDIKIISILNQKIKVGSEYSRKEVKELLTKIYNDIGLTKKAKATDIEKYFEVSNKTIYEKGKNVSCLLIIDSKPI